MAWEVRAAAAASLEREPASGWKEFGGEVGGEKACSMRASLFSIPFPGLSLCVCFALQKRERCRDSALSPCIQLWKSSKGQQQQQQNKGEGANNN